MAFQMRSFRQSFFDFPSMPPFDGSYILRNTPFIYHYNSLFLQHFICIQRARSSNITSNTKSVFKTNVEEET